MEYQGKAILIDCGEGTLIALREAGCRLNHLETILLTHYSPALTDPQAAVSLAQDYFPGVVAAHDGVRLELG